MPNYGKEFTALKKKMNSEKKRHQKRGARFGSCKCDEMAAEAVQRAQMAYGQGKFGKAQAFEKLAFGFWGKGRTGVDMTAGDYPEDSMYDSVPVEELALEGSGKRFPDPKDRRKRRGMVKRHRDRNLLGGPLKEFDGQSQESMWGFGYDPRLWEMQGPVYNAGYR